MTADLRPGDIVQITNERPGLVGAFLLVTEAKTWGVQGFVHNVTTFTDADRIYLRLKHGQYEYIGRAHLVPADLEQG